MAVSRSRIQEKSLWPHLVYSRIFDNLNLSNGSKSLGIARKAQSKNQGENIGIR
jgi:hypothetical protein